MKSYAIYIVPAFTGIAMSLWEDAPVLVHAVGLCGILPLAILAFLWPALMGSSKNDGLVITRADRDQFRRDVAGEYTKAELAQLHASENANYVAHMSAFARREESRDSAGNIIWRDVVTDQCGNQHVVASGSCASTWDVVEDPEDKPEIIFGQVEEEYPFRYYTGQLKSGKGGRQ